MVSPVRPEAAEGAGASFLDVQRAFAAHLRDPQANPAPAGIEPRRLAIYRDLFFNNVEGFLAGFFPVLRSLYPDAAWLALARDFFARHRCRSPYFLEIAEEFLQYLEHERGAQPDDPPFLCELAHYEWLELVLDVATEEIPRDGIDPAGDLLAGSPVPNPVAVLAPYRWPVHRISAAYRPHEPLASPVFLLAWRDREDRVRFLEPNAVTARLLTLVRERPSATGRDLALALAADMAHPDPEALVVSAGEALAMLRERDILLGTRLEPTCPA